MAVLLSLGEGAMAGAAPADGAGSPDGAGTVVEPTAEPGPHRRTVTLDALPVGRPAWVVSIEGDHDADLALEGLLPGTAIAVASRSPLGGPLVVGIGRARVAVARSVASRVSVSFEPIADVAVEIAG